VVDDSSLDSRSPIPDPLAPEPAHPAFSRLLVTDFHRLLSHALLIFILLSLLGLLGLARLWLSGLFVELSDELLITAVLPAGADDAQRQGLREALEKQPEVFRRVPFGPENARERLAAAGVDVGSLDEALLKNQPSGESFHWHRLALDLSGLRAFARRLTADQGAQVLWDEGRATALHEGAVAMASLVRRLRMWGSLILIFALILIALVFGRPRLGVRLSSGEIAQALAVRGGMAALLAWVVTGAFLSLVARQIGLAGADSAWWPLLLVVPIAAAIGPLGLFGGSSEISP
jgi:hypothetical protein